MPELGGLIERQALVGVFKIIDAAIALYGFMQKIDQ